MNTFGSVIQNKCNPKRFKFKQVHVIYKKYTLWKNEKNESIYRWLYLLFI